MDERSNNIVHTVSDGGVSATHQDQQSLLVLVAPSTANERNLIRSPLIPLACWRIEELLFAFDSSFVKPNGKEELQALKAL